MRSWALSLLAVGLLAVGCAGKDTRPICAAESWKAYGTYERCLEARALELERLERQGRHLSSWERRDRRPARKDLW